jgi:hypothetical protein
MVAGSGKAEREERLAAALRDNLKRRKAAARQRSGAGDAATGSVADVPATDGGEADMRDPDRIEPKPSTPGPEGR